MPKTKTIIVCAHRVPDEKVTLFGNTRQIVNSAMECIVRVCENGTLEEKKKLSVECADAPGEYNQIICAVHRRGLYMIGFARLDTVEGPALGDILGNINSFNLKKEQGFSNMSAAIYDPANGAFIVTNRKSTASCLGMFAMIMEVGGYAASISSCAPTPLIRKDIEDKIRNSTHCKKLEVKLCPALLCDDYYEKGTALGKSISYMGMRNFSGMLTLTLEGAKQESWFSKFIPWRREVESLRAEDAVKKLRISVKDDGNDDSFQLLNLLDAVVCGKVNVAVGAEKYIHPNMMFSQMEAKYQDWKSLYDEIEP